MTGWKCGNRFGKPAGGGERLVWWPNSCTDFRSDSGQDFVEATLDFFRNQGNVDFALLVCEPRLVPFYERLGWQLFPGELLVTQQQATVPFTFNLPMTLLIRLRDSLSGTIDHFGPPW